MAYEHPWRQMIFDFKKRSIFPSNQPNLGANTKHDEASWRIENDSGYTF